MSFSSETDLMTECESQEQQDNDLQHEYRKDRSLIFHLIYAMEIYDYDVSLASLVDNFNRGFELEIDPQSPLVQTAQAIIDQRNLLDDNIKPLLANWRFDRIGVCTKLILRMALWEFINTDTDPKIIINEAIELAKCFAERDAYKFINGILDEFLKRSGRTPVATESPIS